MRRTSKANLFVLVLDVLVLLLVVHASHEACSDGMVSLHFSHTDSRPPSIQQLCFACWIAPHAAANGY